MSDAQDESLPADEELPVGPVPEDVAGADDADDVFDELAEVAEHEQSTGHDAPNRVAVEVERDEFRDAFLRVKADFENYKKRQSKDNAAATERVVIGLVEQLLPVLDAADLAVAQGHDGAEPIAGALRVALEKQGLERLDVTGDPFDPTLHEAVLREEGDGDEQVVVEVLRPGYRWNGALVRAAMVKVKG